MCASKLTLIDGLLALDEDQAAQMWRPELSRQDFGGCDIVRLVRKDLEKTFRTDDFHIIWTQVECSHGHLLEESYNKIESPGYPFAGD
jgi:hypothetical protein